MTVHISTETPLTEEEIIRQAEAALATQPRPSRTTGRGPRPEDVLREIEGSE